MQLALVRGRVTTTVRHRSLAGRKLLVVQNLGATGEPEGDPMIVVDALGAGQGDVVILSSDGQGVRELVGDETSPLRWYTLGIADSVEHATRH